MMKYHISDQSLALIDTKRSDDYHSSKIQQGETDDVAALLDFPLFDHSRQWKNG